MPKYPDHLIASTPLLALSNLAHAVKFKQAGAQTKIALSIRASSENASQIGIESYIKDVELHQVELHEVHAAEAGSDATLRPPSRYKPIEVLSQYDLTIQLFDTCETSSRDSYSSFSSAGLVRLYHKGEQRAFRVISLSQIFVSLTQRDEKHLSADAPEQHLGVIRVSPSSI